VQLLEDTGFSPAGKSLIGGVPIAILFGEQSPLSATASYPKDGREETSALPLCADVKFRARA